MTEIRVNVNKSYNIYIKNGLLREIGALALQALKKACKIMVVTDSNVAPLYLPLVKKTLIAAGFDVSEFVFEAGEKSKNFDSFCRIVSAAAENGFTRGDAMLALGGGVCGDLTGFSAATYMRGIRYIQVPTTLLAGIDASIGGKTGIDTEFGKNLVGAFCQPEAVIFDTETLATLPQAEIKNGLGEGIKYAVLCGGEIEKILADGLTAENIDRFCALCAEYKAKIVTADEKESGMRKLLNLGHTTGHAIEKLSSYSLPHGVAVALGIELMAEAATAEGVLNKKDCAKISSLLTKYDLKGELGYDKEKIIENVKFDKKMTSDGIEIIEIRGMGNCAIRKMAVEQYGEYIKCLQK